MRKLYRSAFAAGLVACVALAIFGLPNMPAYAEPWQKTVSVTQTNQTFALPTNTKFVRIIAGGANTCYLRLFTDIETPAAATTSDPSISIATGESLGFPFRTDDSESYGPGARKAKYYKAMSAICGTGETATWRVIAK